MFNKIASKIRKWLLKGAVVINAEKVEFNNCTFTVHDGVGLCFDGGEVTIHGDVTAVNEADEGWAVALSASGHATVEVARMDMPDKKEDSVKVSAIRKLNGES